MKKILLSILVTLMVTGVVFAEEKDIKLKASGDVWAWITSSSASSGDTSVSSMTNNTYGLFGFEVSNNVGDYTTKSVLAFEGSDSTIGLYELYAGIESKTMEYKLGYLDPSDVTQGMDYLPFWGEVFYNGIYVAQGNYISVGFKELKLDVALGFNNIQHVADTDTTADNSVDQTVLGVYYRGEFDALDLGFAYVMVDNKLDPNKNPTAEATAYGDYGSTAISLGVNYKMSESIAFAVNLESVTESSANAKDVSSMKTNLSGDIGFDKKSGMTVATSSISTTDDSSNPTQFSRTEIGYARDYDDFQTGIAYFMESVKDTDTSQDDSTSGFLLGFFMGF